MLLGFLRGQQKTRTSTTTSCYLQGIQTYNFINAIYNGLETTFIKLTFSFDVVKDLFLNFNNLFVQLSDQATACQDLNKVKQFTTRTTKVSGLMNFVYTAGYGSVPFSKFGISGWGDTDLYSAESKLFFGLYDGFTRNTPLTCETMGYYFGVIYSEMLDFRIDDTVYFTEVIKYQ
jgi:hypothetical protein